MDQDGHTGNPRIVRLQEEIADLKLALGYFIIITQKKVAN